MKKGLDSRQMHKTNKSRSEEIVASTIHSLSANNNRETFDEFFLSNFKLGSILITKHSELFDKERKKDIPFIVLKKPGLNQLLRQRWLGLNRHEKIASLWNKTWTRDMPAFFGPRDHPSVKHWGPCRLLSQNKLTISIYIDVDTANIPFLIDLAAWLITNSM